MQTNLIKITLQSLCIWYAILFINYQHWVIIFCFIQCHVVKLAGDKVLLRLTDEERKDCKIPELCRPQFEAPVDHTMDYSLTADQGLPDMVEIDELNHATLMQNLFARYKNNNIYTYVGPIILAMNPFKNLDKMLYTQQ